MVISFKRIFLVLLLLYIWFLLIILSSILILLLLIIKDVDFELIELLILSYRQVVVLTN